MKRKILSMEQLSKLLLVFLGLQLISPMAIAAEGNNGNQPNLTPTLSTPTMTPTAPYTVETDQVFTYKLSNFSGNVYMTAEIKDADGNVMRSWDIGNKTNGTHTVEWDGTFTGNQKPYYGQTYTFSVKGLTGTFPNFSVHGPKTINFLVAEPSLSVPTVDSDPYNPELDANGLVITTTVSNLYSDEYTHLYAHIYKDNMLKRTLDKKFPSNANGSQTITWDGMIGNDEAEDGQYKVVVSGVYGNSDPSFGTDIDAKETTFEVKSQNIIVIDIDPSFTTPTASDNPFDIGVPNNTNIFKTTLQNAFQNNVNVTAGIYVDDGLKNQPLYSWSLTNQGGGEKVFTWEGEDSNGELVDPGNYYFQVLGQQNSENLTPMSVKFTVIDSTLPEPEPPVEPTITNLVAKPSTFSPDGDNDDDATEISFTLESDKAADVSITIGSNADYGANVELYDATKSAGEVTYVWNGKLPGSNTVAPDGTYPLKVKVSNADGSDESTVNVTLDTDGNVEPDPQPDCGFTDATTVAKNDPKLCAAFKFVKDRGIFVGDKGTTNVRPYAVINRAEAGAVIERTFEDSITHYPSDGTNLGFVDVDVNAWYMTDGTMRTAVKNGILKGDSNGKTMRPGDQVNNAEFVTMFVRATQNHATKYKTLPDVTKAPYLDTPLSAATMWYAETANALKEWFGLYSNKQYFYPAEGRTRADVVVLIYDAYNAGLDI